MAGSIIVREHAGVLHEVLVVPDGFCWQGKTFESLSTIAKAITGTNWNGPRRKNPEIPKSALETRRNFGAPNRPIEVSETIDAIRSPVTL